MTIQTELGETEISDLVRPLTRDAHLQMHGHEVEVAGLSELVKFVSIETNGDTLHEASRALPRCLGEARGRDGDGELVSGSAFGGAE